MKFVDYYQQIIDLSLTCVKQVHALPLNYIFITTFMLHMFVLSHNCPCSEILLVFLLGKRRELPNGIQGTMQCWGSNPGFPHSKPLVSYHIVVLEGASQVVLTRSSRAPLVNLGLGTGCSLQGYMQCDVQGTKWFLSLNWVSSI